MVPLLRQQRRRPRQARGWKRTTLLQKASATKAATKVKASKTKEEVEEKGDTSEAKHQLPDQKPAACISNRTQQGRFARISFTTRKPDS